MHAALYESANIIHPAGQELEAEALGLLGAGEKGRATKGQGGAGAQALLACCTECRPTAHRSSPSRKRRRRSDRCRGLMQEEARGRQEEETFTSFGARHPAPGATSRRRDGGTGEAAIRPAAPLGNCTRRATALPLIGPPAPHLPITWRPSADPGQKRDPATGPKLKKAISGSAQAHSQISPANLVDDAGIARPFEATAHQQFLQAVQPAEPAHDCRAQ